MTTRRDLLTAAAATLMAVTGRAWASGEEYDSIMERLSGPPPPKEPLTPGVVWGSPEIHVRCRLCGYEQRGEWMVSGHAIVLEAGGRRYGTCLTRLGEALCEGGVAVRLK